MSEDEFGVASTSRGALSELGELVTQSPVGFIKIVSTDKLVVRLQEQIEKSILLNMWIGKAVALLDRYVETLDKLDREADSVGRGILIEALESHFMSAIILYHRCFVDQPSMHLEINKVTNDDRLRQVYKEIESLRNDEFIHWKGIRSNLSVSYSFEAVASNQVKFAEQVQGHFSDSIGPGPAVAPFKELFLVTGKYVEQRRNEILDKLRSHISKEDVFLKCQFLNENGESVIRKV